MAIYGHVLGPRAPPSARPPARGRLKGGGAAALGLSRRRPPRASSRRSAALAAAAASSSAGRHGRGNRRAGDRQRLGHVQGGLRGRRRAPGRVPVHRGAAAAPGRHGGHGAEGLVRGRRGAEQARHPDAQVPDRARHRHQLGRHGEDLAPHLLQRAARGPRGAPGAAHRGPPEPQGQPREDDPDHVRDLQHPGHVRGHPGRAVAVRLRAHHGHRHGLGRRRHAHGAHLRGLRPAPRHPASGPGGPGPDGLPHEDPDGARLQLHHHGRARDRARHQGEALLRGPGLRAGDGHRRLLLLPGEELRAARRAGDHHRQRALPLPRGALPALLPGYGVVRHPRDHLQLDHEVRRGHPQGPVRQHGAVGGHHHVPRHRRPHAEGDHGPGPQHHEDQDHRPPGAQVLGVDRRLHPGLAVHLPADVDQQAGVRRVGPVHRPPQMLLDGLSGCQAPAAGAGCEVPIGPGRCAHLTPASRLE